MAAPNVPNWEAAILRGVGARPTPENLRFVRAWVQAEGGSATNNPFNTTEQFGPTSNYNSVGVKNYGSPQQGIQATVRTLMNGRYGAILDALHRGTSAVADAQAESTTPWGTGSLILKVLGAPGGGAPAPAPAAFGGASSAPRPPAPSAAAGSSGHTSPTGPTGLERLLASTIGETNQSFGLGGGGALASLLLSRMGGR